MQVMNLSALGSRIKAERKNQGITLEKLAEQVGISRNFLWEIEAGRKAPALRTLYNLSVTLNLSTDYLMDIHKEQNSTRGNPEREFQISKILKHLDHYETSELLLISNVLGDFEDYILRSRKECGPRISSVYREIP